MGELARRRSGRDIWISRGHVWAVSAGAAVAAVLAFGVGFASGRASAPQETVDVQSFASSVPDEALVELLARVEAGAARDGGIEELTFPDALRGHIAGPTSAAPAAGAASEAVAQVAAGEPPELHADPPAQQGHFVILVERFRDVLDARSLRDDLREAGLPTWVGVQRVDGALVYKVSVGGYGRRSSAEQALSEIEDRVPLARPQLVER